jgi:phage head maturation protease
MNITRAAEIRGINNENRTAEFIISSETVDRHGTSFKLDAWDLANYNRNPIVCYNHNSSGDNPDTIVGTSEVFKDGANLIGRVTFEAEGDNPLADKVWKKINKGLLKMASVGAIVHEYRYGNTSKGEQSDTLYFTRAELLEWSIVSVGSNPDAFKRSAEQIDQLKARLTPAPETMSVETAAKLRKFRLAKIKTN